LAAIGCPPPVNSAKTLTNKEDVDSDEGCARVDDAAVKRLRPAVVFRARGGAVYCPAYRFVLVGSCSMTTFAEARDIVDAFAAALNAKDAEALGELFSEDAEFVNILGMRMRQRAGIVAGHAWAFAGPLQGRVINFDAVDELEVTDDVTLLHAHCVRRRLPDAPVAGLPDGASVLVFVARRGPDGWQAVAATNVTEAPPPDA
jgi:uncharacterized protein (TIGR02246 family)